MTGEKHIKPEKISKKDSGLEKEQQSKKGKSQVHEKSSKAKREPHDSEAEFKAKLDELNDKYLRLYSEFDNFRKRTLKEKVELTKTASEEVIASLLPVLDDLERALKASNEAAGSEQYDEGIRLIFNKFKLILEQRGLKEITAIGEPFDVDYHDAITNIPAPADDLKGRVVDQVEKGYTLNGKVIRYAKVIVGV